MRLAILGATGATGRELVREALERGHELRVLARDPSRVAGGGGAVTVVTGDARDPGAVAAVLGGVEAVVSAVGPTKEDRRVCSRATENVLGAMREHGIRRYVLLSGAAVTAPEDRKTLGDKLADFFVRTMERGGVQDKQREYELLVASEVDWTAVRIPRLVGGEPTGALRASLVRPVARMVRRRDVVRFLLDQIGQLGQLGDDRYLRRAPFVG